MTELGWKSVGVLELTALPTIDPEHWVFKLRDADVPLVSGGDALYLSHWMRESGLVELLPSLTETVYVGMSAGSMVMTPRIGRYFVEWAPPSGDDATLGVVDFSIFPHLDSSATGPSRSSPRGTGSPVPQGCRARFREPEGQRRAPCLIRYSKTRSPGGEPR
jgi:hypothetical protein